MARIQITALAQRDLDEIWFHIALDNPTAADSIVDVIGEKSYLLAANPLAGRARAELAEALRSFPAGRYLLFYRPLPDGIEMVRILDAARDIDTEFQAG